MKVNFITKAKGKFTGLSKYERSLYPLISKKISVDLYEVKPLMFPSSILKVFKYFNLDILTASANHPFFLKPKPQYGIWHISSQNLASLLNFANPDKSVVTVHDLLPFVKKKEICPYGRMERVLNYLSFRGMRRSDMIIAISEYTKRCIIDYLGFPEDKVRMIYQGVDHERFRVIQNPEKRIGKYGFFKKDYHKILYVGSEEPRKNIATLLRALYKLKKRVPNFVLIKVGEPHMIQERRRLVALIEQLHLRKNVIFTEYVPEQDMPFFYNSADIFVFPSLYEGFGLPVLEAMACGIPVISSCLTSLPEVVGDAGILIDPLDVQALENAIYDVIIDSNIKDELARKSLNQAKKFDWEKTAKETLKVYKELGC